MRWFIQVVIAVNIALVAFVDEVGTIFHVGPNARLIAAEPIFSRQYAAAALGYAIVLAFVVWPRFQREPIWLLLPTITLAALWLDAVYELAAGTALVSENLPPMIIRALFVASYASGYFVLRRRSLVQRTPTAAVGAAR